MTIKRINHNHKINTNTVPQARGLSMLAKRLPQREVRVAHVTNQTAKAYLAAQLNQVLKEPRTIFWLTETQKKAEEIYQLISWWDSHFNLKQNISLLEDGNIPLLFKLIPAGPNIIISDFATMLEPLPTPQALVSSVLRLSVDQKLTPINLAQALISLGYEPAEEADSQGLFAQRGGIIDIYPKDQDQPWRIEFSGKFITSLYTVDLRTKRARPAKGPLLIIPERLSGQSQGDILDYLPKDALVVLADPEQLGDLTPYWNEVTQEISQFDKLMFLTFSSENALILDFQAPTFYHSNFEYLAKDIKIYYKQGWKIFYITADSKALLNFLKEKNLGSGKEVIKLSSPMPISGFRSEKEKLLVLTDQEIFGLQSEAKKNGRSNNIDLQFVTDLKPGDYVVHIDHGIGRFTGLQRSRVDTIEKEYFVLEYASDPDSKRQEGDKLLVPVDSADKLSKYIGAENPKLHRLSSSNWHQITRRVREDASNIARDLLKLYANREMAKATAFGPNQPEEEELEHSFLYDETPDQLEAINAVKQDMQKTRPMDRLICGDVGFGKTEVAIRAAMKAVMNGTQVALLSPTTILTQQHYDTFKTRLKKFPVKIGLLSRFQSPKNQKEVVSGVKLGDINIVIGTHRLLSGDIGFKNLGLIIIDEEQRFGVRHKEQLKKLRTQAHLLTLTATPIPRTLNLSLSTIKDISVIETPPEGRLPIQTIIQPYTDKLVKHAIERELGRQGQVYYLYNNVETIELEKMRLQRMLPKARFSIAHGQLPEGELIAAMKEFDQGKTDVLVCSTIIENGLDLPNVNTLIVENATNFGLAQLYQLRGRIGRGHRQAFSHFLYHSRKLNDQAKKRLQALLEAQELGSGLQLALRDMEIRGTGNILGRAQHGNVAAIGLNLYLRLLAQAIEEIKTGKKLQPIRDIMIDLPMPICIPRDFIISEPKRLRIYQQLANIIDRKELVAYRKKKFKNIELPEPLRNLFEVLDLKLLAQRTDVHRIEQTKISLGGVPKERIVLQFIRQIHPDQIKRLLDHNPDWDFTENSIKIDKSKLGSKWLNEIKEVMTIFSIRATERKSS
ncbi:MAG: transcription-repair coupling factor [Patescibacteria group bacterium]